MSDVGLDRLKYVLQKGNGMYSSLIRNQSCETHAQLLALAWKMSVL